MADGGNQEKKIRAFIAAGIDLPVLSRIGQLTDKLKKTGAGVKWVRPEAMHLTLRFLGSISEEQVDLADRAMIESARLVEPVEVEIKGFGTFPPKKRPRVLWLGLSAGAPELTALSEILEGKLAEQGFPPADKPFSAHLTLGRVKSGRGLKRAMEVLDSETKKSFGSFTVDALNLYQSRLHPEGARYTVLAERALGLGVSVGDS